jgi:hypothetical protein
MASWSQFAAAAPSLAASIRAAIHQYGAGFGYLATIRPDGGPRLHPVSPAIVGNGLYCCLLDTPKRRDLERDARYALHAFPSDDSEDEAGVRGRVRVIDEPGAVRRISTAMRAEPRMEWRLYELCIDTAFYVQRGSPAADLPVPAHQALSQQTPAHQTWVDPRPLALRYAC